MYLQLDDTINVCFFLWEVKSSCQGLFNTRSCGNALIDRSFDKLRARKLIFCIDPGQLWGKLVL
jgi:hypothetical protein